MAKAKGEHNSQLKLFITIFLWSPAVRVIQVSLCLTSLMFFLLKLLFLDLAFDLLIGLSSILFNSSSNFPRGLLSLSYSTIFVLHPNPHQAHPNCLRSLSCVRGNKSSVLLSEFGVAHPRVYALVSLVWKRTTPHAYTHHTYALGEFHRLLWGWYWNGGSW